MLLVRVHLVLVSNLVLITHQVPITHNRHRYLVGTALRHNPFAPHIPCHRVIATNGFVGGYCGEWGPEGKAGGKMYNKKLTLLEDEGVQFDTKGMLRDRTLIWSGKSV